MAIDRFAINWNNEANNKRLFIIKPGKHLYFSAETIAPSASKLIAQKHKMAWGLALSTIPQIPNLCYRIPRPNLGDLRIINRRTFFITRTCRSITLIRSYADPLAFRLNILLEIAAQRAAQRRSCYGQCRPTLQNILCRRLLK